MNIKDKIAIVTGASMGIGEAVARGGGGRTPLFCGILST